MIVNKIEKDNIVTLSIAGRIDTTTSPELRGTIAEISQDVDELIIDFKDVTYISSAGLRELLICNKRFGSNRMRITNVSHEIHDIFTCHSSKVSLYPISNCCLFQTICPVFTSNKLTVCLK